MDNPLFDLSKYIEEKEEKKSKYFIFFNEIIKSSFFSFSFFSLIILIIIFGFSIESNLLKIFISVFISICLFKSRSYYLNKISLLGKQDYIYNNIITTFNLYGLIKTSTSFYYILLKSKQIKTEYPEIFSIINKSVNININNIIQLLNASQTFYQNKNDGNKKITNYDFSKKNYSEYKFLFFKLSKRKNKFLIDILGLIKIGKTSNFEGIEILDNFILVGFKDNFEGIKIGPIMLGNKYKNNKENRTQFEGKKKSDNPIFHYLESSNEYNDFYNYLLENSEFEKEIRKSIENLEEVKKHCNEIIKLKPIGYSSMKSDEHDELMKQLDQEKKILNELNSN